MNTQRHYIYRRHNAVWQVGYFESPRYRTFVSLAETGDSKWAAIAETKRLINVRRVRENRTPQQVIADMMGRP